MKSRHKEVVSKICPSCEDKMVIWNRNDPYFLLEHVTKMFPIDKNKVKESAEIL